MCQLYTSNWELNLVFECINLMIIIEQSAECSSDLHLVFVDFEKDFDSVDSEGLCMALRRRGIRNKIVSVIKSTYNGAKCRVLRNGTFSVLFVVSSAQWFVTQNFWK